MVRVSQGVQRFQTRTQELKNEATSEDRNVTKREVASALYEMVKNDKLSQADRKAAQKLIDSDIPLTAGAKQLVQGFSEADQQSLMQVRLAGVQGGRDLDSTAQPNRVYSSLDRLNGMVELFTDRGNRKLDMGEVQALAGFYTGLRPSSRAKIHDRMIEIYQNSGFSRGQQESFRHLLESRGFSRAELEGVEPGTVSGFHNMSNSAKVDHLHEIYAEHHGYMLEYSALRDVADGDVTGAAQGKIDTTIQDIVTRALADLQASGEDGIEAYRGDSKTIYSVDENGDPDLSTKLAIGVEVHQLFGNGGNTQTHYFELSGDYLGSDILFEE